MASTLREFCVKEYQMFILEAAMPEELRRALRTHERVPVMIDKLVHEFRAVPNAKRETIALAVRDVSRWFVNAVKLKAEQRRMSDLAKITIQKDQDRVDQFKKDVETLDEKGAMHVLETSESFEEARSQAGLSAKEYRTDPDVPTGTGALSPTGNA